MWYGSCILRRVNHLRHRAGIGVTYALTVITAGVCLCFRPSAANKHSGCFSPILQTEAAAA